MRIAYWTLDEVNLALAAWWAEDHGVEMEPLFCHDEVPVGPDWAYLVDLDRVPASFLLALADKLATLAQPVRIAVHTYNSDLVPPGEWLQRNLRVYRRLDAAVIQDLCEPAPVAETVESAAIAQTLVQPVLVVSPGRA